MSDQLDVHTNPGRNKRAIPFVVVVQSNRFRASVQRVVVPLLDEAEFGLPDSDVGPHVTVLGRRVVLDPRQITHVPREALAEPVASLMDDEARIMLALDALFSRAWR